MTTDHQGAELKPCPFCGGSAEITERDVEPQGDPWYGKRLETFVVCGCGACLFDGGFHEGFYDPETRAIAAWNRRPAPAAGGDGLPELPEQVARVYWTLHDGPHVGWQSYKAMNAAILEGPQPERPLYTADQMRQYARDAVAAERAPFAQYLKDGETPIQRLERERADVLAVTGLLAKEKFRSEKLEADLRKEAAILDWLSMHAVNVRSPMPKGGSLNLFWASPDDEGDYQVPSDLRAQCLGAIGTARPGKKKRTVPSDSAAEGGGENVG